MPHTKNRCSWVSGAEQLYLDYHDKEWGVPVYDDQKLFEFLILEGAQAGLSWITVLKKRENYRACLHQFDAEKIARFKQDKIEKLLENPGIIRNHLKIQATITNAKAYLQVKEEWSSFSDYIWHFVQGKPLQNHWETIKQVPTATAVSDALSKDLKKRGFKFVGTTICYAFMQAVGIVNDHTSHCFRHAEVAKMSKAKKRI